MSRCSKEINQDIHSLECFLVCLCPIHGKSQTNPGISGSLIPPRPRGFGKAGKQKEFRDPPGHLIPGFFFNILEGCDGNIKEFGLKPGIPWNLTGIESFPPISPLEFIPSAGSLLFPGLVLPGFSHVSQHPSGMFIFHHGSFPTGWELTRFQRVGN